MFRNREQYSVCSGDLLLLNPSQPHELFAQVEKGATILCLQISPRFFRDSFPTLSKVFFQKVKLGNSETINWYNAITVDFVKTAIAYIDAHLHYEVLCAAKINEIFFNLLEHIPYQFLSDADRLAIQKKADRISRFLDFVDANFMYKINLGDFAEIEGLTLHHMSYFVKENLNQTFQEYVSNIRYNHACKLLLSGNKTLKDICFESGFLTCGILRKRFCRKQG